MHTFIRLGQNINRRVQPRRRTVNIKFKYKYTVNMPRLRKYKCTMSLLGQVSEALELGFLQHGQRVELLHREFILVLMAALEEKILQQS